jgi:hypothetical protein
MSEQLHDVSESMAKGATTAPQKRAGRLVSGSGKNHYIAVRPGGRSTYVAFGTDAPTMAEATAPRLANVVRFTDTHHNFARGVPGFAESLDALFCWLRDRQDDHPVYLVGEGAGASLALLASMMLPHARSLAMNPVLSPGIDIAEPLGIPHPFWGNVRRLAEGRRANQLGITLFSAWDPAHASILGDEDARLPAYGVTLAMPCYGSAVMYLRRRGGLAALLDRGTDALRSLMDDKVLYLPSDAGTPRQFREFHEVHMALASKSREARRKAMKLVERNASWANPGWQLERARLLRRENLLPQALVAAREAATGAPEMVDCCVTFARLARETESTDDYAQAAAMLEPFLRQRGIADLRQSLLEII